jgi:hypothetical protein
MWASRPHRSALGGAKGHDGRRDQPDRETTGMPMADISRLRPGGRSTDAKEVRDDHDERNDEKDVDQPTGCRDCDKPEEPKHQDHACDYKQHFEYLPFKDCPNWS